MQGIRVHRFFLLFGDGYDDGFEFVFVENQFVFPDQRRVDDGDDFLAVLRFVENQVGSSRDVSIRGLLGQVFL